MHDHAVAVARQAMTGRTIDVKACLATFKQLAGKFDPFGEIVYELAVHLPRIEVFVYAAAVVGNGSRHDVLRGTPRERGECRSLVGFEAPVVPHIPMATGKAQNAKKSYYAAHSSRTREVLTA